MHLAASQGLPKTPSMDALAAEVQMPFAFYDFETTAANPAFDQPLQFAAVLTDDDFNEVDRVNLRCRLAPHILPSPMAMVITSMSHAMMTDPTLPSWFEFAQMLRELIDWWSPGCRSARSRCD